MTLSALNVPTGRWDDGSKLECEGTTCSMESRKAEEKHARGSPEHGGIPTAQTPIPHCLKTPQCHWGNGQSCPGVVAWSIYLSPLTMNCSCSMCPL